MLVPLVPLTLVVGTVVVVVRFEPLGIGTDVAIDPALVFASAGGVV